MSSPTYAEMLIDAPVPAASSDWSAQDRHHYLLGFEAAMDLGIEVAREADAEIARLKAELVQAHTALQRTAR